MPGLVKNPNLTQIVKEMKQIEFLIVSQFLGSTYNPFLINSVL